MNIIYHPIFLEHDTGNHPENPGRLRSLGQLKTTEFPDYGEAYLTLIHTENYIRSAKEISSRGGKLDADTYVSLKSYAAAVSAVGATIYAAETNGFAVVRPPGHHAYPDHSGGFCIFNNIAIAVKKLVGEGKRVMIIDIDSHLGDGTEKIFYASREVLYCSIHQETSYPGGGSVSDIGYGPGLGYSVNIPVPEESGDDIFSEGLAEIISIGKQFNPDVVGISAGFDGHINDPLLNLRLSVNSYYSAGKIIRQTFPRIFATLEGGYNPADLPGCLFGFLAGVNDEKLTYIEERTETAILKLEEFSVRINDLRKNMQPYWKL